jgi:LPS-assembly protein
MAPPCPGRRLGPFLVMAAALCGVLVPAGAQERGSRPGGPAAPDASEIKIIARSRVITQDRISASGDVEIHYKTVKVFADRLEYTPATKDVMAEGNVVIQTPGEVTRADRAFYNLDTGRGRIENASGILEPTLLFEALDMRREAADFYSLRRAKVTACAQPVPRWSFSASRANLRTGDYVEMWNTVLRVKSIPVLYVPYLRYPLKTDRATGFLMPKVGFSGPKGPMYSQSFYWVMARNMDATVGVDYYVRRGTGLGLEYRYLFAGGTTGAVNLYYFLFKKDAATGLRPSPASSVKINHIQKLPLGFSLTADVDYQTSFDFLREFDNSFREASVSNRSSQAYLSRSWAGINVSARASLFETYFSQAGDAIRNESLPQVNFNVFKVKLLAPIYFSMKAGYTSWRYGWRSEYEAGTEKRSSNLAVNPSLTWPFTSIPWLTANASVTANLVYYGQSLDPEAGTVVDKGLFAPNYDVNLEMTGPILYRVFYDKKGEARLKNIIEPFLNYQYDSPVSQAGRIVTSYGFFRFHQMAYGFNSRFLYKANDRPVEVLAFGLSQTYYFSPADGPLGRFLIDGKPPRFSEASGFVRFYPVADFSLDASLGFNPYYHNLSSLRVTGTAGSRGDGRFFSLSWFRSSNSWIVGADPTLTSLYNRHQVNLFGGWRLPGLGLDLQGELDYNIRDKKVLYTAVQAVHHFQCLEFMLDVRVFYYRLRPETQVRFSMGLGNIGRTPDFLGGLGF